MRQAVDLKKAYRLLNHGPTVLVSSAYGDQRNVMAAAWSMPLDFDPPKITVVIDKNTLTRELVEASGEFALNIPARALAAVTEAVGNRSGRDGDKFAEFSLTTFEAEKIGAPLLDGCVGWLECKVIEERRNQDKYDLFIAEVVAAWADPCDFSNGHWHFESGRPRSIHYVAGGTFFETGEAFSVKEVNLPPPAAAFVD
ncbi:flavin reductase family protein [Chitinimonas sp. PSY-7]|uniref:flavin reductase n=1 Tax=Chitinimonas sp. PSY-7 TaxID=3459088 RepID=UPI00403FD4CF